METETHRNGFVNGNGIATENNNSADGNAVVYLNEFPELGSGKLNNGEQNNNNGDIASGSGSKKKKKRAPPPNRLPPRLHPGMMENNAASSSQNGDGNNMNGGAHATNNGGYASNTSASSYNRMSSQTSGGSSTCQLQIPADERKHLQADNNAGPSANPSTVSMRKAVQAVAAKTNVNIDYYINKDRSLSVNVSGKVDCISEAKRLLQRDLMRQAQDVLNIPQQYHKFILGKRGVQLAKIEKNTATRITMPGSGVPSDEIVIVGSKDCVVAAKNELLNVYHEQAKRAQESIDIPRDYHPLICGPYNRHIDLLRERTLTKINMPPPSAQSDTITLSGEKEGVALALRELVFLRDKLAEDFNTISFAIEKSQHRYIVGVRGSGVNEILEQTGVYVEVPPIDSKHEGLLLKGPTSKLSLAIAMVMERAKSMQQKTLKVPQWLRRYLIGAKRSKLKDLIGEREKIRVDFPDSNEDIVTVEGPQEEVQEVVTILEAEVKRLLATLTYEDIPAEQVYHKHVIGRNGSNIERLQREFGIEVRVQQTCIRIEGTPEAVRSAKQDIMEMLAKVENEKQKDVIIDHRFHKQIIGASGRNIREFRTAHPNVNVIFPDASLQSDIVRLQGPRQDVDAVAIKLMSAYKELANVEELIVQIPASLHSALIGSKGHVLRNIQAECGGAVQIKFPTPPGNAASSNNNADKLVLKSDQILIRGPKDEALKAKQLLLQLVKEKEALSFEDTLECPVEWHRFLIGKRGSNLEQIRKSTGARVILPSMESVSTGNNSTAADEKIIVIGSKEGVVKAKELLNKQIQDLKSTVEKETSIAPKWHKHFVQRKFQVLNNISQEFGGVNISFPRPSTAPGEDTSPLVKVKGPPLFVDSAIQRLQEIVQDLVAQVILEINVPQQYHRSLIGTGGQQVRDIQEEFDVNIKFPPAANANTQESSNNFGGTSFEPQPNAASLDVVIVSGRSENCERAKTALLELVPLDESVELANEFHRMLIGQRGTGIQQLQRTHNVQIQIPDAHEQTDEISVRGTPKNIREFKEQLNTLKKQWEVEKEDRLARSYTEDLYIPIKFHRQLIGVRGVRVTEMSTKYNVGINIPNTLKAAANKNKNVENGAEDDTEDKSMTNGETEAEHDKDSESGVPTTTSDENDPAEKITVTGYKVDVEKAVAALKERVKTIESMVTESLNLPYEIHNRIIGPRGRNLRQIIDQYGVEEVTFSNTSANDRDLVLVVGLPDKVDACCDHLVNIANDFMEDFYEKERIRAAKAPVTPAVLFQAAQTGKHSQSRGQYDGKSGGQGFTVQGAPWQQKNAANNKAGGADANAPNHDDANEFPSIGENGNN